MSSLCLTLVTLLATHDSEYARIVFRSKNGHAHVRICVHRSNMRGQASTKYMRSFIASGEGLLRFLLLLAK
jgi:hypothetical protein